MSIATTTVFLYIGFDEARRETPTQAWPDTGNDGFLGLLDWLELHAAHLEMVYDTELADLHLPVCFDYEITTEVGSWLYKNPDADVSDMADELRRLVKQESTKHLRS